MSKRRPSKNPKVESHGEQALYELCVKLGYCIPPADQEAILADPPSDAEGFVDAVLIAEGLDPSRYLTETRRPMLEIVTKWLYNEPGRLG